MKVPAIIVLLTFFLTVMALKWSPEDYEIFKLNDKIKKDLGPDASFYLWIKVLPKASVQEINKAYRKLSLLLHPDKFSSKLKKIRKQAEDRFQRLSLVGNILRDQLLRKRYDFFYNKGFPTLKGSGYYYSKFRPGIFLTLAMLWVLVSLLHYASLKINRSQDKTRLADLKAQIKNQAWGGSLIPPADGSDRKVASDSGKTFLVKNSGEVFLQEDEHLVLLDEEEINLNPGFKETLFFKLPAGLWNFTGGRFTKKIDTTVHFKSPTVSQSQSAPEKKTKKKNRGNKVELPNGKVVYRKK